MGLSAKQKTEVHYEQHRNVGDHRSCRVLRHLRHLGMLQVLGTPPSRVRDLSEKERQVPYEQEVRVQDLRLGVRSRREQQRGVRRPSGGLGVPGLRRREGRLRTGVQLKKERRGSSAAPFFCDIIVRSN